MASASSPAAVDARQLRAALGRYATGVTIVSCVDADGSPVGLTANSFNSLSLEPALVLWSLRRESPSAPAFSAALRFAVNVLAESHAALSQRFASRGVDRFAEGGWSAGAAAVFECETVSSQLAGDHLLFIGRVLACRDSALRPLLFHAGHYRALGDLLQP
jgi:3-hydroxy-9,10-secoandrosta-1,3,5(10)-triene-9,17-dione monooxygenase reductase component